ncbi:MAG: metallophosphoesterase family protein [Gemmatimonadota bacterium]
MKVALLGDIHGNLPALRAVLDEAREEGIERLLVTGDIVGYYFWPRACLEALSAWQAEIVRGNHEDMLREAQADPRRADAIREKFGSGIDIALHELDEDQLRLIDAWPRTLPARVAGRSLLVCHGSPEDTNEYVYPDASPDQLARMVVPGATVVAFGHTHHPMVRELEGCTLANPGSVGQPRNRQSGACWATYDGSTDSIDLRVTNYDALSVAEEARRRHPELPHLSRVLLAS